MGFFDRVLRTSPRAAPPVVDPAVLTLAPAVLRMSIAAKGAGAEIEALGAAVAQVGYPEGFTPARVFAVASELSRMIQVEGIAAVTARVKTGLDLAGRADAMRLALVAVFLSPHGDEGDIGILAGLAEQLGMSEVEFDALVATARMPA